MKHLVLGYDCHFGRSREGSPEPIVREAPKHGFTVSVVPAVQLGSEIVSSTRIRNALIVFQFAVSIILLSSTGIVARQMHFIRSRDVGYDREQILTVRGRDMNFRQNLAALKTELLRSAAVAGVSVGCTPMDTQGGGPMTFIGEDGSEFKFMCWKAYVDYDFLDVFNVKLLGGRFFSRLAGRPRPAEPEHARPVDGSVERGQPHGRLP